MWVQRSPGWAGPDRGGDDVSASDRADYAPSWYTATAVPAPAARAVDRRSRCGCLRGRCGSGRPHHGARDRPRRLVGGGGGGRPDRLECVRTELRLRAAGLCGGHRHHRGAGRARSGARNCGRCRKPASTMCAPPSTTPACRASIRSDGWLNVSKTDDADRIIATLQLLGQDFGAEVEGWATDRVRDVLRSDRYFNALHFPRAFHLHPLNYALGLAARRRSGGGAYFRAHAGGDDRPGRRAQAHRDAAGRLRAAHVVLAGNVHIGALMPRVAATLLPIWTYLAVTAPLGPRLADAITFHGAVSDGERADNHYRIVDGDRLLISGRATMWEADPGRFAGELAADIAQALSAARTRSRSSTAGRACSAAPSTACRRSASFRPASGWRAVSAATASIPPRWPAT